MIAIVDIIHIRAALLLMGVPAFFFKVMLMKYIVVILFLLGSLLMACNKQAIQQAATIEKIEIPTSEAKRYTFRTFAFDCADIAQLDTLKSANKGHIWFNIIYPELNSIVHCSYLPITKSTFNKAIEDNYQLVYGHITVSEGIDQHLYSNNATNVAGIMYQLRGNVATPIQFYATDSVNHFLRGSFYYTKDMQTDSIEAITEYISKDIDRLMNTLKWISSK
ncbi:MAG: hypothetical protein RL662_1164 [Bacteroidota bacterium]